MTLSLIMCPPALFSGLNIERPIFLISFRRIGAFKCKIRTVRFPKPHFLNVPWTKTGTAEITHY